MFRLSSLRSYNRFSLTVIFINTRSTCKKVPLHFFSLGWSFCFVNKMINLDTWLVAFQLFNFKISTFRCVWICVCIYIYIYYVCMCEWVWVCVEKVHHRFILINSNSNIEWIVVLRVHLMWQPHVHLEVPFWWYPLICWDLSWILNRLQWLSFQE